MSTTSETMLALSKVEPVLNGLALNRLAVPQPGPGQVRLKVKAAGVCGTDMQIYNWAPRMARRLKLPVVIGHEVCGVVDRLGEGVSGPAIGTRVALESHIWCGECYACRMDRAHLCENTSYPGVDWDGGFAEYVVVPAKICWPVPDEMPDEIAAMLEPYGIAVHAAHEGSGVSGQSVLISGCGPIGLMAVAVARALGASLVMASEPLAIRRETAARVGADVTIDPLAEDVPARVKALTGGRGADVVMEFSGNPQGFKAVFASVCRGGDVRLVAAPAHPLEMDFTTWVRDCPRIFTIHGRRIWRSWVQGQALMEAGKIDLRPLLSHVLPLSEAPSAFDLVLKGQAVKPILVPGG